MIDDIVALPRKLQQVPKGADISSEACYSRPISCITRINGYESHHDDDWRQFGGTFTLPGGTATLFRYKLVECTPKSILEFFCLSENPIDIIRPLRSKKTKLYCLWVTHNDLKTMRTRKYVLWRSIRELIRFETEDNVVDAPIEAVIADEIRSFAKMYGDVEILNEISKYPKEKEDVLISEVPFDPDDAVDKLQLLGSNMLSFHDLYDTESFFSPVCPMDIFRGVNLPVVWTDLTPIKVSAILPFVQFGSILLGEILHLISPMYKLHNFQRGFREMPIDVLTRTDLPSDDFKELFRIIKYTEALPYSEFELQIERNGKDDFKLSDHAYLSRFNKAIVEESQLVAKAVIKSIRHALETGFPNYVSATLRKSWEEEIYITITNSDNSVEKFFYDLSGASICSRSLIRDCDGPIFSMGL